MEVERAIAVLRGAGRLRLKLGHSDCLTTEARVVVCGDFNSSPDLDEIPAEDHGFVDATKSTAAKRCHRRKKTSQLA